MKLLFYDDSPVFGGHEVMTLLGVSALLAEQGVQVDFLASGSNATLLAKLGAMAEVSPGLRVVPVPERSSKLEALRNRMQPARVRDLAARLKHAAPDLVVAVQGNIEHSSLVLLAARAAGLKSTSYIPVPHSHAEMGAKLGALRDLTCRHLFQAPDTFVTISGEMERLLRERGATCPIHVVFNGVDTERFQPKPQAACRGKLGLPMDACVIGMVGRIEFSQKQQHLLVEAVKSDPALVSGCHLVFAGDGPDAGGLRELVKGLRATLLPWSDPAELYPALDALVIPSRYEGLPLVMLEALACSTPVIGSDRDGMKELLPAGLKFTPGSATALAGKLRSFIDEGMPRAPGELVRRVREEMSLEAFGKAFRTSIRALAGGK